MAHEADAQRQYVRVPLPAYIQLSGQLYAMSDWSVRGATVSLDKAKGEIGFKSGQTMAAMLLFKMDSFALQVPMEISIGQVDPLKKRMGVIFQNVSSRQLSILQQLVSAYISGELTSAEDIIHVVERNNFVKSRSIPKPRPASFTQQGALLLRKVIIFGTGLLLFGYLLLSIYERNFIIEASNAYVDAGGFTVNTPSGGTVLFANVSQGDAVKEGSPLAIIQSRTGTSATLESPCNCTVHQTLVAQGNYVNEGDSIITLVPSGARMYVTALVPYEEARELYEGQEAHIALAGASARMKAKIDYISNAPAAENNMYQLRLATEDPIAPKLLGTPAHVTIDTFR